MFIVFLNPSLKSAFGQFQGQKCELDGPWEVIITLGLARALLCVINYCSGGVEGWLHREGFVVTIILTLLFFSPFLGCSLPFPRAVVAPAFLQRSVLAGFCGFEGGISFHLDPGAGSAPSWGTANLPLWGFMGFSALIFQGWWFWWAPGCGFFLQPLKPLNLGSV